MTKKTSDFAIASAVNSATEFLIRNAAGNGRLTYAAMLAFIQANSSGTAGKNPEFQQAAGYLQWRLVGDATWINLVALSAIKGADGLGVPTGGATGQVLAKKSGTANDTQWIDPPAGGGGSGDVTKAGDNAFTGTNTFSKLLTASNGLKALGPTEIAGGSIQFSAALRKAGPTEGGTWSPTAGVSQQVVTMAADINAATIVFPNDPATGIEITLFLEKQITAATFVGGTMWGGTQALSVIGAPATLRPGGHTFRLILAETPNWYYIN